MIEMARSYASRETGGAEKASESERSGTSLEIPKAAYQKPLSGYALISVNPKEINDLHLKTNPAMAIKGGAGQTGSRIENAKDYISTQGWNKQKAEAPRVGLTEDGKLSISDGRHRLVASEELGVQKTFIQVPLEQVRLFKRIMSGG